MRRDPNRRRVPANQGRCSLRRTLGCPRAGRVLRRSSCLAFARARSNSGCIGTPWGWREEKGNGVTTIDDGCHNGRGDTARSPEAWGRRRGRTPVSSMPVSPAERECPQRRWRTASTSARSSRESSCAPPQCSLRNGDENISTRKWRALRTTTQRTCARAATQCSVAPRRGAGRFLAPSRGAPHLQPGVRPASSIHCSSSGRCVSSTEVTLTYRVRSAVPSGGGESKSAPPRKTTFTETS